MATWDYSLRLVARFLTAVKITIFAKSEMDGDSESTATSVDENTENFCENPTRDTLAEGLMGLIKPAVDQLDERIRVTRCVHTTPPKLFSESVF